MKHLLFIMLLMTALITSGCVGGNQNSLVTPTKTAASISSDPIVGIWQWTLSDGSKIYTFSFFPDSRFSFTDSLDPNTSPGTWSKVRENEYLISYTNGKTQALVYNSNTDTFIMPEFPQVLVYRVGKEPVRTAIAQPTTTVIPTVNPTVKATSIYKVGDKIYVNQPGDIISKYRVGDIIWETSSPYRSDLGGDMCVVIYDVDSVTKKYTIDFVWRDAGTTRWYREYPELDSFSIISIDRDYPYLIDHIDISKLASHFPSKAAYDAYYK